MILKYPVNYIAITQYFKTGVHNGIDLGWNSNYGGPNQPVYAAYEGTVIAVEKNYNQTDTSGGSYGNYVKIRHENNIDTLYAHLKYGSVTVNIGDKVTTSTQIGEMGNTGYAFGNHLHYEVFLNNVKVNPENYTYVFPGQITSSDKEATKGLLYYTPPTPPSPPNEEETKEELKKQIKELEDKIALQSKEIEVLKEELKENENYVFTYNVKKTSLYEIELYDGEILLIRNNNPEETE